MADLDLYNQVAQSGRDPILAHVGLVKRTALHLKARIPQVMDVDELIQVGMIGLIEASQSFDTTRGVDFEIFARTPIRGAILDEVRKFPYSHGLPYHTFVRPMRPPKIATELGRAPSQSELADFMGKDAVEYQKNALTRIKCLWSILRPRKTKCSILPLKTGTSRNKKSETP